MAKSSPRLGRGLNTLIRPAALPNHSTTPAPVAAPDAPDARIREITLEAICPNPLQPRAHFDNESLSTLVESIRARGVLQPILVRSLGDDRFELIAGERRWRAARAAGLKTIPAIIRDLAQNESLEVALIENLQREDLTALERATAYQHYLDTFGGSIEDLAQRLSESRANVSNYLRILKLSEEVRGMISSGDLGRGQARAIAGLDNPQKQLALARLAVRRNLSVRQVEDLVRNAADLDHQEPAPRRASAPAQATHLGNLEQSLSRALGLRVRLHAGRKKNSGRVVITFQNLDEFDRIAERLGGKAELE
jgi:ParB family chromosome partitioning protein